jgi:hypothetical protein
MGMDANAPRSLALSIDAVEEAYEFMLAYAAQGVVGETTGPERGIRPFLQQLAGALEGMADAAAAEARRLPAPLAAAAADFVILVAADAARALTAVRLVLALPCIGSQIVDNLNASIHLRTLLTDLFLIDEACKPEPRRR